MRRNQKGKGHYLLAFAMLGDAKKGRQNISTKHRQGDKLVEWDSNWTPYQRALYHLMSILNERSKQSADEPMMHKMAFTNLPWKN
jgi:hypothetical protein